MRFRCERDSLAEALAKAGRAISSRGGSLPVLSGLRLDLAGSKLTITGSDLDTTIRVTLAVDGERDGVAVITAKLASEIVKAFEPGAVTVAVDDDEASLVSGRSEFTVRLLPADEFPQLAEPADTAVTLPVADLAKALRQVVPAASSDDARPILTGVLFSAESDGLRLVATDSYRLSVRDLRGVNALREGQSVLVPKKALEELTRLLGETGELTLRLGERDATFEIGSTRLSTRLVEGEFPNYRSLIPANQPNRLTVGREALLEALRRARILATDATPVRLAMSADGLELIVNSQDVGQAHEELDAKYEGTELTVGFNPQYLLDGIEVTSGDEITLETVDALKPALVRTPENEDFLYLLMPVRVS